jgi:hypothetical protein
LKKKSIFCVLHSFTSRRGAGVISSKLYLDFIRIVWILSPARWEVGGDLWRKRPEACAKNGKIQA